MRLRKWKKGGALLLVVSLAVVALGGFAIWLNRERENSRKDTEGLDEYIRLKMELDDELAALRQQYRSIEAKLTGTVVLMFDQCAPNAYDVVFKQISEFNMAGCLVFRGVLPGDEGAITAAQWTEMQASGWTAVLGSTEELTAFKDEADYTQRIADYATRMIDAFEALGFRAPAAYSFEQGEGSEDVMTALSELGFVTFTGSDMQTATVGDKGVALKELYICADPKAPLLQSSVNGIRNKADALVIKTRYVMEVTDIEKDTDITKFRLGMLPTLAAYRQDGTIRIETSEGAIDSYKDQLAIVAQIEREKAGMQAEIDAIEIKLDDLWRKYRME